MLRDALVIYLCYRIFTLHASKLDLITLLLLVILLIFTIWFLLEKIGIIPKLT